MQLSVPDEHRKNTYDSVEIWASMRDGSADRQSLSQAATEQQVACYKQYSTAG